MLAELTTRERLMLLVDDARVDMRGPFTWGKDDCLLMYADRLRDILGYDAARPFRGHYRTARGAYRMLKRMGYSSVAEAVVARAAALGWRRVGPVDAQPGDIGVVQTGNAQGCAMLARSGFWIARGMHGFAALTAQHVIVAFDPIPGAPEA